MKTPRFFALASLLALLAPAALPASAVPALASHRPVAADGEIREARTVAAFTRVVLAGSMEVIVAQGAAEKVEVVGLPADVKMVETRVEQGSLRVGTVPHVGTSWRHYTKSVRVYVTVTTLEGLSVSGSGLLHADAPLTGKAVAVAVSGSGQLRVPLQAEAVDASVSGSGQLKLSGSTQTLKAGVSGSGRIEASELKSTSCGARVSGSGNCHVFAAETLDAQVSGSGSVHYSGSPRVTSRVSGSGRVRRS